jgi:hypothetical protein
MVGHTSLTQARHGGTLKSNLKSRADPETTEVKMDSARAEEIPIRQERIGGVLNSVNTRQL